ncbi:MAG: APC family permease [Candidatus Tyrphobacter sp.]
MARVAARPLPKVLRFFDVSVLSSASMGPAYSLAATTGPLVAAAGFAAPAAVAAMALIMLCIAIAYAMLSRVSPNAGSAYSWVRESFGSHAGAYAAWLLLLSNFFATLATAVPVGLYTLALVAPAHESDPRWAAVVGAIWIVGSALLLYAGIRPTATVTLVALLVELGVLAASALASLVLPAAPIVRSSHAAVPITLAGVFAAMTLSVWTVDGWELSAATSEEVRDVRASGRGGVTGLVVTSAIMCLCMLAYLRIGGVGGLAANQTDALAYVGDRLGGGLWRVALVVTVLASSLSALWTTILYLSRSVYAMGRDGVLSRAMGTLDRHGEPLWALVAIAIVAVLSELVTGFSPNAAVQLDLVLDCSSLFLGLLFAFSALACVRRFLHERARFGGVLLPLIGAALLLAVLGLGVATEAPLLRWYALAGVLAGVIFALWRARRVAPEGYEQGLQNNRRQRPSGRIDF